jgi:hypothetical protein
MLNEKGTKTCSICPHVIDCVTARSCLDDVNTKYLVDSRQLFPRLMTPVQAKRCAALLRAGWTLRRLHNGGGEGTPIVSPSKLQNHCAAYPEWGAEAWRLAKVNAKAADKLKGRDRRNQTHCKRSHSLADAFIHVSPEGWVMRNCRTCHEARRDRIEPLPPAKLQEVKTLLIAKKSISDITGKHLRGKKRSIIVNSTRFYNARKADLEFDLFVKRHIVDSNARAQRLRQSLSRTHKATSEQREQAKEYRAIRAMFPAWMPDLDELVSRIFEDMLSGSLDRDDVVKRIRFYTQEREKLFPTKFRKFGDGLLVSLDENLFDDGTLTRGDTVSRGLWD